MLKEFKLAQTHPPEMTDNIMLENALVSLKGLIFDREKSGSEESKSRAVDLVTQVLGDTRGLHGFTLKDFMNLMQISIIGLAYVNKNISDAWLLSTLAGVVPEDLSKKAVFRKESEEDGSPRLWFYSDVAAELEGQGLPSHKVYSLFRSYGEYALFVSGIFADLFSNNRKRVVDVQYYEVTGSRALGVAARNRVVAKSQASLTLEELARNFPDYRQLLTEASAQIGAPARRMFMDEFYSGLVKAYGSSDKVEGQKRLPERKQVAGLPLFELDTTQYSKSSSAVN